VKYAVEQAEEWLSGKVTIDYYNSIKDDLFFDFNTAEQELDFIKNKKSDEFAEFLVTITQCE